MRSPQRILLGLLFVVTLRQLSAQQPAEPYDPSPLDGDAYYLINQKAGLQLDLPGHGGPLSASPVLQSRSFTSLSQRWGLTRLPDGNWEISNESSHRCLTSFGLAVAQAPCLTLRNQEWAFQQYANGYRTIRNIGTNQLLKANGPTASVTPIAESDSASPQQEYLWLLRPVFFRGSHTAEQEKMEQLRVANNLPWWKDATVPGDILQILKNHGFNTIRLSPTSTPPYYPNQQPGTCSGNSCYIETDAQDLDFAKRARDLGMSIELTLFYDGGHSATIPGAWANDSAAQLQTDFYNYTKSEIEMYRKAGVMPDLVSLGDEVDTGFFGPNYYPWTNFANFATLQRAGMQAIHDAAADSSIGAPIPAPLTCIHVTPAFNLSTFFQDVNAYGIPYDAMCQSYYAVYHGPLTQAQANAANPLSQPVEQPMLEQAIATIQKPVFIIETAEHFEEGFLVDDPWYYPSTPANQRQFLIDLTGVLKALPNNYAMGIEYWAPNDVMMPDGTGPYGSFQDDYTTVNALYQWWGLSLFANADTNYIVDASSPQYSNALPGLDAVGGRLDSTIPYKFVNAATHGDLQPIWSGNGINAAVTTGVDFGVTTTWQQWKIASNGDGYFSIANESASTQGSQALLSGSGTSSSSDLVVQAAANNTAQQEWDVQSAGDGYYHVVNKASGLVLSIGAGGKAVEQEESTAASQEWMIVPVQVSVDLRWPAL